MYDLAICIHNLRTFHPPGHTEVCYTYLDPYILILTMHQILYSLFDMKISRISFHLSMILKFLELRVLYNFARESEFVVSRISINQSYRVVYMTPLSRDEMRGGIILTD